MSNSFFSFKQFTIHQDKCAMKVGTDGVLLGAWTRTLSCKRILDIGTGTGLIALMLAQRSDALIDAIEIDADAAQQAQENIAASLFSERIHVEEADLANFITKPHLPYDLIVSNPPYFIQSLKCPNAQRNQARHTDTLTLDLLLQASNQLLTEQGRLAIIIPYDQREQLLQLLTQESLTLIRETAVIPTPNAQPKRLLAEISHFTNSNEQLSDSLTIEIARHQYTTEYINLTKEFYLKM